MSKVWRTATAGAPSTVITVDQAKGWLNQLLKIADIGVTLGSDVTTPDQIAERMKVIVELNTNETPEKGDAGQDLRMSNRPGSGKRLSHAQARANGRRLLGLPAKQT